MGAGALLVSRKVVWGCVLPQEQTPFPRAIMCPDHSQPRVYVSLGAHIIATVIFDLILLPQSCQTRHMRLPWPAFC